MAQITIEAMITATCYFHNQIGTATEADARQVPQSWLRKLQISCNLLQTSPCMLNINTTLQSLSKVK